MPIKTIVAIAVVHNLSMTAPTNYIPAIHGERRQRPTPMMSRYSIAGGRRKSNDPDSYTDVYPTGVFMAILGITMLNVLDAFFTLVYLQRGGSEANPVADWFLRQGPEFFIFFKTFVMGGALAILCIHKNFERARLGILIGAFLYLMLTVYHIILFVRDDVGHIL